MDHHEHDEDVSEETSSESPYVEKFEQKREISVNNIKGILIMGLGCIIGLISIILESWIGLLSSGTIILLGFGLLGFGIWEESTGKTKSDTRVGYTLLPDAQMPMQDTERIAVMTLLSFSSLAVLTAALLFNSFSGYGGYLTLGCAVGVLLICIWASFKIARRKRPS